jgi:hypothetical protein
MTCNITGLAQLPDGTVAASKTITFRRAPNAVVAQGSAVVIPDAITTTTSAGGLVNFNILAGVYTGSVSTTGGVKSFTFTVNDISSDDWTNCIARVDVTYTPPPSGGVSDGDKGDVIVSSSGTVWALDYAAVNPVIAPTWPNVSGKPTTLAGYGIETETEGLIAAANPVYATRSAFVAAAPSLAPSVGQVERAEGMAYRYIGTGTAISDLAGWVPDDVISPLHWASNTTPGTTDMRAAIIAAMAYASGKAATVEGFGQVYAISAAIYSGAYTDVTFQNFRFIAIGTWAADTAMFNLQNGMTAFAFRQCVFDCNHLSSGLNVSNSNRNEITDCRFVYFVDFGVRTITKATEFRATNCDARQWEFGDTGWDNQANRTAIGFDMRTADFVLLNCVAAYCAKPFSQSAAGFNWQVVGCHFYNGGLTTVTNADAIYTMYLDFPAGGVITNLYTDKGILFINADQLDSSAGKTLQITDARYVNEPLASSNMRIETTLTDNDLAGLWLIGHSFPVSSPNVMFGGAGTFSADTRATYIGVSQADGTPVSGGLPIFATGQGAIVNQSAGVFTFGRYATAVLQSYKSVSISADYDNNTGAGDSEINFYTDGVLKHVIRSSGWIELGSALATGGGQLATLGWSGDNFFIRPTDLAGGANASRDVFYDASASRWEIEGGLFVSGTSAGLTVPRLTTAERDAIASPLNGEVIYNTTLSTMQARVSAAWVSLATGAGLTDGDKGDVTVSGSGAVWTVDAGAITLAKMANMATASVFYRKTAGTGAPEVQTLATLKTDLGLTGTNSGDQTSIVGITGTLAEFNTALTGADFATGGGTATGTNTGDQTITLTGDVTGSGTGSFAATIAAGAVTLAKQASIATGSIMGRTTAGTGVQEVLTPAQAKTVLAIASGDVSGLGSLATASSVSLTTQATGTLQAAQAPAHTGDATSSAGSLALTLATVNSNTGSWGLAGSVAQFTVNAKGLITAAANVAISIASTAISDATAAGRAMLTAASATAQTALLDVFGTSAKGLVPAPGSVTGKVLSDNGTWVTVAGGAATGNGTASVNFGTGAQNTTLAITGQTTIGAGSRIRVWLQGGSTSDWSDYEHQYLLPMLARFTAGPASAGTGFTIYATSDVRLRGTVSVQWEWSN